MSMRAHISIQSIEAFVAVAETGSINRASVRLSLTQPATTRRIQSFEAAFGKDELFDRSVKPATLTSLGRHVLHHCRHVLTAIAELETCARYSANPAGELRVGVAHGLGEMVLTSPLDELRRSFPDVQMLVRPDWTANLVEQIPAGAIDCAVGLLTDSQAVPDSLRQRSLGAERIVIVSASHASTKADGSPWHLRDLSGESWFLNPRGCGCRSALERAFDRENLLLRIAAEVFGEGLQLSLLAHGGGLGLVPYRQLIRSSHHSDLRIIDVANFQLLATITLVSSLIPSRFDPAIELLANQLVAQLQDERRT